MTKQELALEIIDRLKMCIRDSAGGLYGFQESVEVLCLQSGHLFLYPHVFRYKVNGA